MISNTKVHLRRIVPPQSSQGTARPISALPTLHKKRTAGKQQRNTALIQLPRKALIRIFPQKHPISCVPPSQQTSTISINARQKPAPIPLKRTPFYTLFQKIARPPVVRPLPVEALPPVDSNESAPYASRRNLVATPSFADLSKLEEKTAHSSCLLKEKPTEPAKPPISVLLTQNFPAQERITRNPIFSDNSLIHNSYPTEDLQPLSSKGTKEFLKEIPKCSPGVPFIFKFGLNAALCNNKKGSISFKKHLAPMAAQKNNARANHAVPFPFISGAPIKPLLPVSQMRNQDPSAAVPHSFVMPHSQLTVPFYDVPKQHMAHKRAQLLSRFPMDFFSPNAKQTKPCQKANNPLHLSQLSL